MLLKEVRVLTDLQVISESRETGVMCIRGTFQRAEEANHNQRIYPKAVLENCVKSLTEKLSGRELVGELDHPADGVVKLQNASHLITKLEWQGNDLIGEAEILPTPAGQIAKSLINAGVKVGISSRGMGTLSESARGAKIVNDDYKMITFDLVADPSTKGAYPSLAESKQHALDFVENVIKPAISEQAFVARLKKKLDEASKTKDNPWAICTAQVGRGDKAKYERCVKQVKKQDPNQPVSEMCSPKHKKKKKLKEEKTLLRRMISELYGGVSIPGARKRKAPGQDSTAPSLGGDKFKQSSRGVDLGGGSTSTQSSGERTPLTRQNIVSKKAQDEKRKRIARGRMTLRAKAKNSDKPSLGSRVMNRLTLKHLQNSRTPLTLPKLMEVARGAGFDNLSPGARRALEASNAETRGDGKLEGHPRARADRARTLGRGVGVLKKIPNTSPQGNLPVTKTSWVRKRERDEGELG